MNVSFFAVRKMLSDYKPLIKLVHDERRRVMEISGIKEYSSSSDIVYCPTQYIMNRILREEYEALKDHISLSDYVRECKRIQSLSAFDVGKHVVIPDDDFAKALFDTHFDEKGVAYPDVFSHFPVYCLCCDFTKFNVIHGRTGEKISFALISRDISMDKDNIFRTAMAFNVFYITESDGRIIDFYDYFEDVVRLNGDIIKEDMYGETNGFGHIVESCKEVAAILLYMCSDFVDYDGPCERPKNPPVIKTRKGPRCFPSEKEHIWTIGKNIGNAIRSADCARQQPDERNRPRAHLRRAHWHSYRVGPGRAATVLRWLHPVLVGYKDLPAEEFA